MSELGLLLAVVVSAGLIMWFASRLFRRRYGRVSAQSGTGNANETANDAAARARKIVVDFQSPARPLQAATLNEEEYRKVLLVQTIADVAPQILPQMEESELKEEERPEQGMVRVCEQILEHLPAAYRRLAAEPIPWKRLRLVVPLLALMLGGLSNILSPLGLDKFLGPARTIHVFVNPIVLLILWNILVVGIFVILHRRPKADHPEGRLPLPKSQSASQRKLRPSVETDLPFAARIILKPVVKLWTIAVDPMISEGKKSAAHARIAGLFLARYFGAFRSRFTERAKAIMHLSAICLAGGAIIGIYFQAVVWDYSFFWKSTLIQSPEYRAVIIRVLFWPAAVIFGQTFPNTETIAEMANCSGVPGAIWIHVFAVTSAVYIFLPRLFLMSRADSQAEKASDSKTIEIDFISIRDREELEDSSSLQLGTLFERPSRGHFTESVTLDYFTLDSDAISVLLSLQAAMVESDIRNTCAGGWLGDGLTPKRKWYTGWLKATAEALRTLPVGVRPVLYPTESVDFQTVLAKIPRSSNPFVRELILLELAAFEPYRPFTAGGKGWTGKIRDLGKSTPSIGAEIVDQSLRNACDKLGLPQRQGAVLRSEVRNVSRSLSGHWKRIAVIAGIGTAAGALTFGVAAPIIGCIIGHSMGLAGVAAVKAGLVALGGGAVTSGGMGLAGGTAVIFGGGALLGMGVAGSVADSVNPENALVQAVKIQVFLRHAVAKHENGWQITGNVISQLRNSIARMDDELRNSRLDPDTDSRRIAEREEVVKILRTCLERCERRYAKQVQVAPGEQII